MGEKIIAIFLAGALVSVSQSACAMTSSERPQGECRVIGGEKLPPASGGRDALCSAIKQALSAEVPGVSYEAEVRVLSASMLSATVSTADGRKVPEQRHAVMDHVLTRSSFDRFARALATQLAKAAR